MRRRLSLGLLCLTLAACARQADILVTGGMVWTGLSNGAPQKGAVALANGKILAVGDSAQIARYAGPKTQTIQADGGLVLRSEEHTSELQSQSNLVCRLLLEKKKKKRK